MNFFKIGDTWVNLANLTRVQEVRSRVDPTTLNLWFNDRSGAPVTVLLKEEVAAVLDILEKSGRRVVPLGKEKEVATGKEASKDTGKDTGK